MNFGLYGKSVNATVIAIFGTLTIVFADGNLDLTDWLTLLINGLTAAIGITLVKNTTTFRTAKLVVTLLITGIGSVLASVQAGLDIGPLVFMTAALTIANGLAVYNTTEAPKSVTTIDTSYADV